ncbi:MAG: hypothetical protein D6737_14055 [Chloroflexi bacterium]|nr:MAG: hypothetical protein CUN54_03900 [Phototrophicales bacterium]RMF78651.1 MAG: hypothetical protein D6737_14055 [Chloroflexota bacterium]
MNTSTIILLTITITLLLFFIQRAEARRRVVVALFVLIALELTRRYANYNNVQSEALLAFVLSVVFNFLFWALIGRYNPPGSSDDIKVLGLDD